MEFRPLICPQCGGEITNYTPGQAYATCGYCNTRFLIERDKEPDIPMPVYQEIDDSPPDDPNKAVAGIVTVIILALAVSLFIALTTSKGSKSSASSTSSANRKPSPSPAAQLNVFEFGGKGTTDGLFNGASAIAVDSPVGITGSIYVGDETLRVQKFNFLMGAKFDWAIQIPAKGANYESAQKINKLAVGKNGKLYVAVGGVILVYNEGSKKLMATIQVAPDYIQDLALKDDDSMVAVASNERTETLLFINNAGKVTKRISGFHSHAFNDPISPTATAVSAIRLAVNNKGEIYSVYALGSLGSYQISSNNDELMIASFTPGGTFVSKLAKSMNSCGIATDSKGRIYVSNDSAIDVYSAAGEYITGFPNVGRARAFAFDAQNNIYIVADDNVIKRTAVK